MKHWKTIGFNSIIAVLGVLQSSDLQNVFPPQYAGYVITGIAAVNMLLRVNLTPPVGSNDAKT